MSGLLRTLLMCWLVLALPLQGAVAGTLRLCGSDQGPAHQARVLPHTPPALAHAHMGHAHHAVADAGHATGPAQGKCSQCAACCLPAVMPTPPRLPQPAMVALRYREPVPQQLADFLPSTLERPPRTLRA